MERTLTELNFYCYTRLKADELGLTHLEDVVPSTTYAPYYTALDIESELLYRPLDDVIILRCDWDKAKRDYQKYTKSFLNGLSVHASWSGVIGLVAVTKMFIRRYRETNPLFASMFCVEMLDQLNDMGDIAYLSWRKVAKKFTELARKSKTPTSTHCGNCMIRTLILMSLTIGVWQTIKAII